jgi:YVTN family beta-propeller protein
VWGEVDVGAAPCALAVNLVRDELYVANSFADTVTAVNLETAVVTRTMKVDRTPVGAALAPAGDRLYVSNRGAGTVSVLGIDDGAEWARIPVGEGPGGCTVDHVTGHLLVANAGAGSLTVVEDLVAERAPALPPAPPHELVGRKLPPFELPDMRSGIVRTSLEWAERKYILNFFASW